jgi:deoxyribose-phosphate aldolase
VHLKVILETGELGSLDAVRHASDLALNSGLTEHDFIKTSTGKVTPAATMPVTLVMLEAIRDHYHRTGVRIGMKPAGGIRQAKQAWHYLVMVNETLGPAWLTPSLFRFGASAICCASSGSSARATTPPPTTSLWAEPACVLEAGRAGHVR